MNTLATNVFAPSSAASSAPSSVPASTSFSIPGSTPQTRRYRHLETELKYCRWSLLRGNSLVAQGEPESAVKEVWLVEDSAEAMGRVIARIEDADKLNSYQSEIAQLQRELGELRTYLRFPPVDDYDSTC